jgi:arsenate reductase (glutaredoxin)
MSSAWQTPAVDEDLTIWFNPSCSKCRAARELVDGCGVTAAYVEYLDDVPSRRELEHVLEMLGSDDPLVITRTGEARFVELGLAGADRDTLLDALVANPILIERPIAIRGGRAVIARPPEKLLELLGDVRPTG